MRGTRSGQEAEEKRELWPCAYFAEVFCFCLFCNDAVRQISRCRMGQFE